MKEFGPPKIGLNALMGETTKQKLVNVLGHLKSGELELKSGVYKKNNHFKYIYENLNPKKAVDELLILKNEKFL